MSSSGTADGTASSNRSIGAENNGGEQPVASTSHIADSTSYEPGEGSGPTLGRDETEHEAEVVADPPSYGPGERSRSSSGDEPEHEAQVADDRPPDYDSNGQLIRSTSLQITRYFATRRARTRHWVIPPGPPSLYVNQNDRPPPQGWHKMFHPEGQLYFYSASRRVVTDCFIHEPLTLQKVEFWVDRVQQYAAAHGLLLPISSELFIDLDLDTTSCRYYFVDHASRGLFWLDGGNTESLDLPEVSSEDHRRLKMEELYWNHVQYFPNHLKLSPDVEYEIRGMLIHAAADTATSQYSTSPYTFEQCRDFANLIGNLPTTPETNTYKNWILARFMSDLSSHRFINYYGESSARLSRTQRVHEVPRRRTNLTMRTLYKLCFDFPRRCESELDELWVDDISISQHWKKFVLAKVTGWNEHARWALALSLFNGIWFLFPLEAKTTLIATLATSICRSLSITSEILSLGCTMISLLLVRKHQIYIDTDAGEERDYLTHAKHDVLGWQPLSIIYSLPAALLQWVFILSLAVVATTPFRIASPLLSTLTLIALGIVLYAMHAIYEFFRQDGEASWLVCSRELLLWWWWGRRRGGVGEGEYEVLDQEEV